jgi:CpeT protein
LARSGIISTLVLIAVMLSVSSCPAQDIASSGDLAKLVTWMAGSFSSLEQAESDTNFFDVRLEMIPIWTHRTDGYWLYVEQAAAGSLEHPYRQRVYHIAEIAAGTFESKVFTIPEPLRYAGCWKEEEPLSGLAPDSLSEKVGCAVILHSTGDTAFVGGTVLKECPSTHGSAVYAVSEVAVMSDRLISWDRGYDATGNQVWGARMGGYVFKKIAAY